MFDTNRTLTTLRNKAGPEIIVAHIEPARSEVKALKITPPVVTHQTCC